MKKKIASTIFILAVLPLTAEIRNGSFDRFGTPPDAKTVEQIKAKGIKCPDAGQWPQWWSANGAGGEISFPAGGKSGRHARLSGNKAYLVGYHGLPLKGDFVLEIYVRGKGAVCAGFYSYEKTPSGARGVSGAKAAKVVACDVDTEQWERFRFRVTCPDTVWNVHPFFQALKGTIDLEDVRIFRNNDAMMCLADTEVYLRRKKEIPAMTASLPIDEVMKKRTAWFSGLLEKFRKHQFQEDRQKAADGILKAAEQLLPYLVTEGLPNIKGQHNADMLILGSAMQFLMDGSRDIPPELSYAAH